MLPRISSLLSCALAAGVALTGIYPPQEVVDKSRVDGVEPIAPAARPPLNVYMLRETTSIWPDENRFERRGGVLGVEGPLSLPGLLVVWPGLGVVSLPEAMPEVAPLYVWLVANLPAREAPAEPHFVTVEEWEAAGAPGSR